MGLKEMYDTWTFKTGNKLGTKTPRDQKEGDLAVDFLPNTYQKEVRNRTIGDTVVTQATADDKTAGTFNETSAFKYYSTLFASPLKTFKTKLVHKYNAQGKAPADKYETANPNAPGTLYSTNK